MHCHSEKRVATAPVNLIIYWMINYPYSPSGYLSHRGRRHYWLVLHIHFVSPSLVVGAEMPDRTETGDFNFDNLSPHLVVHHSRKNGSCQILSRTGPYNARQSVSQEESRWSVVWVKSSGWRGCNRIEYFDVELGDQTTMQKFSITISSFTRVLRLKNCICCELYCTTVSNVWFYLLANK